MKEATHYLEAIRYIDNAKSILKTIEGSKKSLLYTDEKYVKQAAHTAYTGVLYALDKFFDLKAQKGKHLSENDYTNALSKVNSKMNKHFAEIYRNLHIAGGYEGTLLKKTIIGGIEAAEFLIDWTKVKTNKPLNGIEGIKKKSFTKKKS